MPKNNVRDMIRGLVEAYVADDEPTAIMSQQALLAALDASAEDELRERQERPTAPAGPMALRRAQRPSGERAAYRASAYSQVVPKISCDVVNLRRRKA